MSSDTESQPVSPESVQQQEEEIRLLLRQLLHLVAAWVAERLRDQASKSNRPPAGEAKDQPRE